MADYHEYFDVATEGGRHYLIQAVNAAHAAYNIEIPYQERVVSVARVVYHKIILTGDPQDATETTDKSGENGEADSGTTQSTGNGEDSDEAELADDEQDQAPEDDASGEEVPD